MKKVALELGGKNPNIVFADADREAALDLALTAIFLDSGQVCSAGARLIVEESIAEEFVDELVERVGSSVGWARRLLTHFGEVSLSAATCFTHFRKKDATVRHAAEAIDETEFRKRPDRPFARVPLPWLHAVASSRGRVTFSASSASVPT